MEHPGEVRLSNEDALTKVQLPAVGSDSIKLQEEQGVVLIPAYKKGYSLLYGTELIYVVIKMISTIYERLLKAR